MKEVVKYIEKLKKQGISSEFCIFDVDRKLNFKNCSLVCSGKDCDIYSIQNCKGVKYFRWLTEEEKIERRKEELTKELDKINER